MIYIRKYDYIDSKTFTPTFGIALWLKTCWLDVRIYCYISREKRDLIYEDLIENGLTHVTTQHMSVQLEPPNETDATVFDLWFEQGYC